MEPGRHLVEAGLEPETVEAIGWFDLAQKNPPRWKCGCFVSGASVMLCSYHGGFDAGVKAGDWRHTKPQDEEGK